MKLALWELWSYIQIPLVWWLFRRFARRDIRGSILAGAMLGLFMEFATEPLWTYHFKITLYKHVPLSVLPAWGVMFAITVFVSEKLYFKLLGRSEVGLHDPRIILFDMVSGMVVGLPMEIIGLKAGIWDYRYDRLHWDWGMVPLIHFPYEAVLGYVLMMLTGPTFVRYWGPIFSGERKG